MERSNIINNVINKIDGNDYLEIGVFKGELFKAIRAKRKTAVDPKFLISKKKRYIEFLTSGGNVKYYEQKSDDFFNSINSLKNKFKIDVAFVDGLHTWEQAYRDVINCLEFLSPNGMILIHDCLPPHAAAAIPAGSYEEAENLNLPGWNGEWTGDVWKAIVQLRTHSDLETFVIDTDYGLGVVVKSPNPNRLNFSLEEIKAMNFEYLTKNQTYLMNIKSVDYLYSLRK
jgi:hypothetical protein